MAYKQIKVLGGAIFSLKPFKYSLRLPSHRTARVLLTLRDTYRLSDPHSKLEDIGEAVGLKKIDIAPWKKERMDLLLQENKPLYEAYAKRDPAITRKWIEEVL